MIGWAAGETDRRTGELVKGYFFYDSADTRRCFTQEVADPPPDECAPLWDPPAASRKMAGRPGSLGRTFNLITTVRDLPVTRAAMDWLNNAVSEEDNHQAKSVHAGNKSRGFKGAHFMVDRQRSRLSEHPGTAFHRRIYQAVAGSRPAETM